MFVQTPRPHSLEVVGILNIKRPLDDEKTNTRKRIKIRPVRKVDYKEPMYSGVAMDVYDGVDTERLDASIRAYVAQTKAGGKEAQDRGYKNDDPSIEAEFKLSDPTVPDDWLVLRENLPFDTTQVKTVTLVAPVLQDYEAEFPYIEKSQAWALYVIGKKWVAHVVTDDRLVSRVRLQPNKLNVLWLEKGDYVLLKYYDRIPAPDDQVSKETIGDAFAYSKKELKELGQEEEEADDDADLQEDDDPLQDAESTFHLTDIIYPIEAKFTEEQEYAAMRKRQTYERQMKTYMNSLNFDYVVQPTAKERGEKDGEEPQDQRVQEHVGILLFEFDAPANRRQRQLRLHPSVTRTIGSNIGFEFEAGKADARQLDNFFRFTERARGRMMDEIEARIATSTEQQEEYLKWVEILRNRSRIPPEKRTAELKQGSGVIRRAVAQRRAALEQSRAMLELYTDMMNRPLRHALFYRPTSTINTIGSSDVLKAVRKSFAVNEITTVHVLSVPTFKELQEKFERKVGTLDPWTLRQYVVQFELNTRSAIFLPSGRGWKVVTRTTEKVKSNLPETMETTTKTKSVVRTVSLKRLEKVQLNSNQRLLVKVRVSAESAFQANANFLVIAHRNVPSTIYSAAKALAINRLATTTPFLRETFGLTNDPGSFQITKNEEFVRRFVAKLETLTENKTSAEDIATAQKLFRDPVKFIRYAHTCLYRILASGELKLPGRSQKTENELTFWSRFAALDWSLLPPQFIGDLQFMWFLRRGIQLHPDRRGTCYVLIMKLVNVVAPPGNRRTLEIGAEFLAFMLSNFAFTASQYLPQELKSLRLDQLKVHRLISYNHYPMYDTSVIPSRVRKLYDLKRYYEKELGSPAGVESVTLQVENNVGTLEEKKTVDSSSSAPVDDGDSTDNESTDDESTDDDEVLIRRTGGFFLKQFYKEF